MTLPLRQALLLCLVLVSGSAAAQDDLFADAPGLFDPQPAAAPPSTEQAAEIDDPLNRQLLEHASRGDLQLADAIASLARLNQWSDVDRLLARAAGKNIDDTTLAEMFRRIGPTVYLRIKQQPDLSSAAQAGMDKLRVAANAYVESQDRLNRAIDQLGDPSTDQQLEGTRTLLSGGNAAIQALVAASVADQPLEKRDHLLRTLIALGGGGVDALRQLALYGTPEVRPRALDALARISRKNYVVDLISALHAADATEAERNVAIAHLRRLDGVPTRDASVEALTADLRNKHDVAKRADNDGMTSTLWSVNDQRNGVAHQPTLVMHAAYRELYDAAARLHRIGNLSPELDAAMLAIAMGYNLMIDPDWGDAEQIQPVRDRYGHLLNGAALSRVIEYALDSDDHAALIGVIRLIDPDAISETDRFDLLHGTAGLASPLVRAALSSEPRVRYEAALKVAQLADNSPYSGSSQVRRTLSEMVSLSDHPKVILVETRPHVVIAVESLLRDLGLDVDVVRTVAQLQRSVASGGDLRMVIAKSQLADLPPIEMIDLVRRMDRGRGVPIAVYGEEVPFLGEQRWTAPMSWIEGEVSLARLDELLDLARRSRRMPPLTILDRQDYRDRAATLLGL